MSHEVTWQNVPEAAIVGRDAVLDLLADILRWSDTVRWDVVSAEYGDSSARVERDDRFWIDGNEHAVRCDGVFVVDPGSGLVRSIVDRADLDDWRSRIIPVYRRLRERPAVDVVARHLDAVRRRDVVAMAADYALDADLERGESIHRGWFAIADYFDDAVLRLGDDALEFGPVQTDGARRASFDWRVLDGTDGRTVRASGRDSCEVDGGFIVHQRVELDGGDF